MPSPMLSQALLNPQQSIPGVADVQRQQALAQQLLQQGMTPIDPLQSSGRYIVPISPFQGLAKLAATGFGAHFQKKADEGAAAIQAQRTKAIAAALTGNNPADALLQDPMTADLGQQLKMAQLQEAQKGYNLGPGERHFVNGQQVSAGAPKLEYRDLGNQVGVFDETGQQVGSLPKGVDPGTQMREEGENRRFAGVSGSALLGAQTARRGQDMADSRAQTGQLPVGYQRAADGTLAFIPGGPADPNKAKRAAPTEFQGKSAIYGARAQEADKILNSLDYSPSTVSAKNSLDAIPTIVGGGLARGAANLAMSPTNQRAEQAQRDFVNAVLRQESGAAISASEFDSARKQYFPQPGDSKEVVAQKARNRQIEIEGLKRNASQAAYEPGDPMPPQAGQQQPANVIDWHDLP